MRLFMDYMVLPTCITVYNSYEVSKKEFDPFLNELREGYEGNLVLYYRSNRNLTDEWACHNFLYDIDFLGLFRSHTKDVDMQYPLRWWEKIAYPCLGWFCKIFIK